MEKEIVEELGDNHTDPISFDDVNDYDEVYGIYTYEGEVCCLKGGYDMNFDILSEKEQKLVYNRFTSGKWKVSPTLQ